MSLSDAQRDKLLGIESRLREHPFPPQLVIENTSACNQLCIHCSHREMRRPKKHMPRALWNKIVAEVGREAPDTEIWPTFYGPLGLDDRSPSRLPSPSRPRYTRHLPTPIR